MPEDAIAFDTHRFVKRLTESGFTERQAETLAEEHVALLNANLATKADLARVDAGLKADIESLRQETKADIEALKTDLAKVEAALKADMARLEARLLRWMLGALIAQGGLIVALIKLL